jgi:hypothetical protein
VHRDFPGQCPRARTPRSPSPSGPPRSPRAGGSDRRSPRPGLRVMLRVGFVRVRGRRRGRWAGPRFAGIGDRAPSRSPPPICRNPSRRGVGGDAPPSPSPGGLKRPTQPQPQPPSRCFSLTEPQPQPPTGWQAPTEPQWAPAESCVFARDLYGPSLQDAVHHHDADAQRALSPARARKRAIPELAESGTLPRPRRASGT